MTPRFKFALAGLGALVLATGTLWLALGPVGKSKARGGSSVSDAGHEAPATPVPDTVRIPGGAGLEGSGTDVPSAVPAGEMRPGLRVPEGLDLSDPKAAREHLAKILATEPVDWDQAAEVIGVMNEPLDAATKDRLIDELRGGNRLGVLRVFEVLQDGSVTPSLFSLLDDPDLPPPAKSAVLQALWSVPGADAGEVVRGLESRITGDPRNDVAILQAISLRGGREGARALVEYLQRSRDARSVPVFILQRLDLERDPSAVQVVVDALNADQSPETLTKLLEMARRPGVAEFAAPLVALDREGVPDNVRQQVLASLAGNGTDVAIRHILQVAGEEGSRGEAAMHVIGGISSATKEGRELLVRALSTVDRSPHPDDAKQQLLLALGSLRETSALPHMAEALRAREPKVRLAGVRGLGRLGPPAQPHVPGLVQQYGDGDETMKRHVVLALAQIGGPDALSTLDQIRSDPKAPASLRRTADQAYNQAQALGEGGAVPAPADPAPGLMGSPGGTQGPR